MAEDFKGKGSWQRPLNIPYSEYERRWDAIFVKVPKDNDHEDCVCKNGGPKCPDCKHDKE